MKQSVILLLSCVLLLAMLPAVSMAAEEQLVATEEDVILLAGSDFQGTNNSTTQIENVLDILSIHGLTHADGAFFVGDYTTEKRETNTSSAGIAVLKKLFRPYVGDNMIFTQGNHDHVDTKGLAKDGANDPVSGKYGVFVINENQRMEYNDDTAYEDTKQAADALKSYLDDKVKQRWTKPIFVLNHIPLHWSNRTISQGVSAHAELLVKVLNEGGAKGLNIIYLFGHNHSSGYDDAMGGSAIYFKKGDSIEVPISAEYFIDAHKAKKKHTTYTLGFTYMNAGYIGDYSTDEATADATVTMSAFLIRGDAVIITRYDSEIHIGKNKVGVHNLKSAGVWHEKYSAADCVTPNTLVYTSSRRVTATADVAVPYPRYAPVEEDDWDEDPTTTVTATTTTNAATSTNATTTESKVDSPCVMPEEDGKGSTATVAVTTAVQEKGKDIPKQKNPAPFPWSWVLGMGGAVLLIGAGLTCFLLKRKS